MISLKTKQKRSKKMLDNPGKLCFPGGHLLSGDNYLAGAKRELQEEMFYKQELPEVKFEKLFKIRTNADNDPEFLTAYRTIHPGPFSLDPDEVEKSYFIDVNELVTDIEKNSNNYTESARVLIKKMLGMKRCDWVPENNQLYTDYHDQEWGVPVHNDRLLFEMLILEGAQAGLSWSTILKKRNGYKKVFDNFDVKKMVKYNQAKIDKLLQNPEIVRNKLKIKSTIQNAKVFLEIVEEFGSFDKYLWNYVNNKQIQNKFSSMKEIPAKTELSDQISKDLKKRGMNFVGSTIIYAFMQAVGIVNDHQIDCYRYNQVKNL